MITKIKGTHDYLDLSLFNFLKHSLSEHLALYHFTEIATPLIEPTELFARSLGQQTDVVSKEMYYVHAGDQSAEICLRPEATASTVRAFIENHIQTLPWKVFSVGPMFRHERPQKGRFRQFHQASMEIIGAGSPAQDVHFVAMLERFLQDKLHLENFALIINFLGCKQDREKFKEKLSVFLESVKTELCSTCMVRKEKNIMRVFDCKNDSCQALYRKAPLITNHLCSECDKEWATIQQLLGLLSISFSHVPALVRGLDYYDKLVFEFVSDQLGSQTAFLAGGRYNGLVEQLGGRATPAIGAALGIERTLMLLESVKEQLMLPQQRALYVLIPLAAEQIPVVLLIADTMTAHDLAVEVLIEGDSVKSMMRKADKLGARCAIIVGSDEQEKKEAVIKDMMTGEEKRVAQTEIIEHLKRKH